MRKFGHSIPKSTKEFPVRFVESAVILWLKEESVGQKEIPPTKSKDLTTKRLISSVLTEPVPWLDNLVNPDQRIGDLVARSANKSPPNSFDFKHTLSKWLISGEHRGCVYLSVWIQYSKETNMIKDTGVSHCIFTPGWTLLRPSYVIPKLFPNIVRDLADVVSETFRLFLNLGGIGFKGNIGDMAFPRVISGGPGENYVKWGFGPFTFGASEFVKNTYTSKRQKSISLTNFANLVIEVTSTESHLVNEDPELTSSPSSERCCYSDYPTFDWYLSDETGYLKKIKSLWSGRKFSEIMQD